MSADFSNRATCRLCEKQKDLDDLFDENLRHVLKKLRACTDIMIERNDCLPKFICKTCQINLEFAYKFKIQCEYTDRKWRDLLIEEGVKCIKVDSSHSVEQQVDELDELDIEDCAKEDVGYEIEYINESNIVMIKYEDAINDGVFVIDEAMNGDVSEMSDHTGTAKSYDDLIEQLEDEETKTNDTVEDMCEHDEVGIPENAQLHLDDNIDISFDGIEEYEDIENLDSSDNELQSPEESDIAVLKESNVIEINEYDDEIKNFNHDEEQSKEMVNSNDNEPNDSISHQCEICEDIFKSVSELNKHKKSHKHRFQCKECLKCFSKRYHLRNHLVIHTGENRFKCDECNKVYTNHGNLDRHIRVFHNKERKHICPTCGKGFSQLSILRQHRAVHIEERQFECDICNKCYKTQDYLNLHKELHKPRDQRKIKTYVTKKRSKKPPVKISICSYCGKKSNNLALHQSHIRTHTGEKPYECNMCNKTFAFQQSLRTHRLLHTGEKPFKCEACGLTFRQIGHLKGHQLIHTGEKKHNCLVCKKSFALRGNLTVHMRLHTGETPYHCTQCPKKFYDSNGLKRHKLMHMKQQANSLALGKFDTDIIKLENNSEYVGDEHEISYEGIIQNVDEIDTSSGSHLHYDSNTYNILSISSET